MKQAVAVILLLSFLTGTTIIGEFLKIPLVFIHYTEHQRGTEEMSVFDFLNCHYDNSAHESEDTDSDRDNSLPFKSDELVHAHFSIFLSPGSEELKPLITSRLQYLHQKFTATQTYHSDFWRPPVL
ncbi:MAG: hypothetical protein IPI23_20975 [Bacteroidetes bacterium]|nr:hypothetical protein [Bacteroidota bacterium]MBK7967629.1 hypothetical protein [Bacteroidota bacterium]MBK8413221.1 hypothetical protein [Bacteroidota bacterium]MBK9049116.1 hypothetical protein [Bacteroidota bacterium]MBK9423355.1 hypothetical protein [Bacteroidota bacterium]